MGKKGAKRKTRWRTLSIGAPPGEEDEQDGLKNGYVRREEANSHPFDRNGQTVYKPRRTGSGTTTSGYTSGSSRSRRDDSTGSPSSQPKIIFNEEEYTRITTPRQDVLFKKGYLSQKKPWTSTASTSATPSTTESQSASHSTADGSEMTEDQQLLDTNVVEPSAQLGYGTFYDHLSGYYYEYPVMLVGPPMSEQEPNCLAAMSCGPVPLRPIEWVNPAFAPKFSDQQYSYTDYQTNVDGATMGDEQGAIVRAEEGNDENGNESCAGSGSCSGSVAGEDLLDEEELQAEEVSEIQEGFNGQYVEPSIVQPMQTHVMQPLAQPYIYPGHYMFGPSLVNLNGVTIQSGPMVRCSDVTASTTSVTCAKWKRKKRKRKQKRPSALENTEDEEEEYSSECENGTTPPWSSNSSTSRPLNPECQEFQLRSIVELESTKTGSTSPENLVVEINSPSGENHSNLPLNCPKNGDESKRLTESGFLKEASLNETDSNFHSSNGDLKVDELERLYKETLTLKPRINGIKDEDFQTFSDLSRPTSPEINRTTTPINAETQRLPESYESLVTRPSIPRNKYSKKVREATPGPDLTNSEVENSLESFESKKLEVEEIPTSSSRPITEAVTEWLRKANSPDLFITNPGLEESETESDEENLTKPKNLEGNPMSALSSSNAKMAEFASKMKKIPNSPNFSCEFSDRADVRVASNSRIEEKEKVTFEKGEIVIFDGKLLEILEQRERGEKDRKGIEDSLGIEEPDLLESWEETLDASPILRSKGFQEDSGIVETSPENLEDIPILDDKKKTKIDEAFEVYESCYNGSQFITLDSRFRKQNYHNDGPIPCQAVCCNIQ